MKKLVYCLKLQQKAEPLSRAPYPGPIGEKILQNISKLAWEQWLAHQTLLINEHQLNMLDPEAKSFLLKEMDKFLFGEGSTPPPGFSSPK